MTESHILPEEKRIQLRDDHGKDVLRQFAIKLSASPYVIEIINSLPYNPHEVNFIRKILPDGKIEIVLTKTDRGLGLVVQTTGKNYRETLEIARHLKKKYEK